MPRRAALVTMLGLGSWLLACGDAAGPAAPNAPLRGLIGAVEDVAADALEPVQWEAVTGTRRFRYRLSAWESGILHEGRYEVSFWVVQGVGRTLEIDYQGADQAWHPYVVFTVPPNGLARRPDGTSIARGDSARVTVQLDTAVVLLHMGPTGLAFSDSEPARLRWWYTGAEQDFNGDGVIDALDRELEKLLVVRVQHEAHDPWELLDAVQSLLEQRFDADLHHFSGYAVAW